MRVRNRGFLVVFILLAGQCIAWDEVSCGSKASFVPSGNCTDESCCQRNYEWDLDQCGGVTACNDGALETLKACDTRAGKAPKTSGITYKRTSGTESHNWTVTVSGSGAGSLWMVNGSANGSGDPFSVASAEVRLNGRVIVSATDFTNQAPSSGVLSRDINWLDGDNTVTLTTTGNANQFVTIVLY